jgi:hypothetical protein
MVDRLGAAQGLAEVISAFESGTELVMEQAIEFTANTENDPVCYIFVSQNIDYDCSGFARWVHSFVYVLAFDDGRKIYSVH